MPPSHVLWAGGYALVTTLCTTIAAQYAQLAGTQTRIGTGAWIVAGCGALVAAFGAGKSAWQTEGRPHA